MVWQHLIAVNTHSEIGYMPKRQDFPHYWS